MGYTVIKPAPALNGLISHFSTGTWNENGRQDAIYHAVAGTNMELTFTFRREGTSSVHLVSSSIQGVRTTYGYFPAGHFNEFFGISLLPGAIAPFLKLSPGDLNNRFLELPVTAGKRSELLINEMDATSGLDERIDLVTQFFTSLSKINVQQDELMIKAVTYIKACEGNVTVVDLAKTFFLSPKQFTRRFKALTGLNPKLYARIVRFESGISRHNRIHSLTDVAYKSGYFDQSHFINDFKTFSGINPHMYFKKKLS
ncbi:helix-turn-helix domain-containing protein [Chitinophaga eiseniae]|uniref:Helix-turn-helix domain-containing protein n=1 Tax=Chitinophaga eiseniae TaxID=634771 RepID=A0A847SLK3_9BACT|nr:helix-turn-helix domain-containing protein [Chitinophaga eiseniae]NLR81044.1 helix-turn-helix domain-containing protein [Chitinophaga eiseniae]